MIAGSFFYTDFNLCQILFNAALYPGKGRKLSSESFLPFPAPHPIFQRLLSNITLVIF